MSDPYRRYSAAADRVTASVTRPDFSSDLASEAPQLSSHQVLGSRDVHVPSSDFLHGEVRSSANGLDSFSGAGVYSEPGLGVVYSRPSMAAYAPIEDMKLGSQRFDNAPGISQSIPDISNGRPGSLLNIESSLGRAAGESNVLFVDGLPTDCTRREVGHLFRPFIGYKNIKVVHKEPRRSRDKATVLCFVEFVDAKCALTAVTALHGYKFDDKKLESSTLKITFAQFPFRHPSEHDDAIVGSLTNY